MRHLRSHPSRHIGGVILPVATLGVLLTVCALWLRREFPATGIRTRTLAGHNGPVAGIAFAPDGALLASGSWDKTVNLWDTRTGGLVRTLKGPRAILQSVAFSPDGRTVAGTSEDTTVRLWDVATGAPLPPVLYHHSFAQGLAFSPDGTLLASTGHADKTAKLWDTRTRKRVRTLPGHKGWAGPVAFSPDGKTIATGDMQVVRLWDVGRGKLLRTLPGPLVHWVIFSPDGQLLVSGGAYTNVRFWDTRTWQPVRTLREADVNSVAFSPDAKVLATCGGDTIKFWDVQTGRLERVLPERPLFERLPAWVYRLVPALKPPPRGRVESVVFSPDGKTIAFGSGNDVKLMRIR